MPHKRSPEGQKKRSQRQLRHNEKIVEKDAARAIIRNLCYRDQVSGDIVYTGKDKEKAMINQALKTDPFCVYHTLESKTPHVKARVEKEWFFIEPETARKVLADIEVGEVLNRPAEACWWR